MPCQSDYAEPSYEEIRAKEELNKVTRLLCSTLRDFRKNEHSAYERLLYENDELRQWWINHQKYDKERHKRELRMARNAVKQAKQQQKLAHKKLNDARNKLETLKR